MKRFVAVLVAIACAGCTTRLAVTRVDPANPATRTGIPYPLMFSRYEIAISRQIIGCGNELTVAVRATIKPPSAAPDPDNLFVLDNNSLSSPLKTSSVLVAFSTSGAPLTLNAAAEDRTAQVIANVANIAVSIAKLAAIPGAGALSTAPTLAPERREICSDVVVKALGATRAQATALVAATNIVESRTDDLKALQDKVVAMSPNVDEATKANLGRSYSALVAALDQQKAKKDVLARVLNDIAHVETIYWPGNGNTGKGVAEVPKSVLQRWLARPATNADVDALRVHLSLESLSSEGRNLSVPDVVRPELGVPFRQPVAGKLSVCREPCGANGDAIATSAGDVLQLGYVYYFPCESRPFSNITCAFTMTEAGRVASMGGTNTAATAEVATGALKNVIDKAGEIQQIRATAAQKKLEAETALLKARADRDAAAAALQTDALRGDTDAAAGLRAPTALLDAQRAQAEAEIALAGTRAKLP